MSEETVIKKGDYFMLTTGEYSDYQLNSLHQALQDFCFGDLFSEYLTKHPLTNRYRYIDDNEFISWFFGLKLSVVVKCKDINVTYCKPYFTVEGI